MANQIVRHQRSSVPGRVRAVPGGPPNEPGRNELGTYLEALRHHYWLVLCAGALALFAGWWSQRGKLDEYTAEVLLQHSQDSEMAIFGLGTQTGADFGSRLEILRSRAVLGRVVDSLGLQLRPELPDRRTRVLKAVAVEPNAPSDAYLLREVEGALVLTGRDDRTELAVADPDGLIQGPGFRLIVDQSEFPPDGSGFGFNISYREDAISRLQTKANVEQGKGLDLIRVRYKGPDAQHAANVVNTIAFAYQDHRAATAREAASRSRVFIKERMDILGDSVARVQAQIVAYQESMNIVAPEVEIGSRMQALFGAERELQELNFNRSVLNSRLGQLTSADSQEREGEILSSIMNLGEEYVSGAAGYNTNYQNLVAERRALTQGRFGATAQDEGVQILDSRIASVIITMREAAMHARDLVEQRVSDASRRIARIQAEVDQVPSQTAELTRLEQLLETVKTPYENMATEYYQAQIAEGVEAGDVEVVDPAPVPRLPDPSGRLVTMAIALLSGLLLGSLGAVVLERMDASLKTTDEAERASGYAVLGTIPLIGNGASRSQAVWLGQEAFRSIRTNLRFAFTEEPRVLAVSSPAPGEGKSTVASNLASCYGDQGARVLLIDADLRRPQIHKILEVSQEPGLSDVLLEECELPEAVQPSPVNGKLHVLSSGSVVNNPAELLGSERFERLIRYLRTVYDAILIDTPPVLAVTDAAVVGTVVDGMLVVARANVTDKEALTKAVSELRRVKAPVAGIILNGVESDASGHSYYESYYKDARTADEEERFLLQSAPR
ncbi:MAG: polysaccharide biosynthesis tyrosine autokinase [Longimicrobiales bacterium]